MKGNEMKGIFKIEVDKGIGHFFYTGKLIDLGDNYQINTIKGEILFFRKNQIVQIEQIKEDNI